MGVLKVIKLILHWNATSFIRTDGCVLDAHRQFRLKFAPFSIFFPSLSGSLTSSKGALTTELTASAATRILSLDLI